VAVWLTFLKTTNNIYSASGCVENFDLPNQGRDMQHEPEPGGYEAEGHKTSQPAHSIMLRHLAF
jgi:hypothetical protein